MSSYLNIFIKKKGKEDYIGLLSYSRNSDIYQAIDELGNFYSSDGTKQKLSSDILQEAIQDCTNVINNAKNNIETILSFKVRREEDAGDVNSYKEIINEQESLKSELSMLLKIEEQSTFDYIDSDGLYCYID